MAYYALYYRVHKRTDYFTNMRMFNRIMRPDYYAEQDRKSQMALAKILGAYSGVMDLINNSRR